MSPRGDSSSLRRATSAQLVRQWAILRLLENRDYSVRELADLLGSSKSSIQRDITTLQQHFMIVASPIGAQKRTYRLARQRAPRSVLITRAELQAVEHAAARAEPPHDEPLRDLTRKLMALVPHEAPGVEPD